MKETVLVHPLNNKAKFKWGIKKKKYNELDFRVKPLMLHKSSVSAKAYTGLIYMWAVKIKVSDQYM